jgi:hypothetical protein
MKSNTINNGKMKKAGIILISTVIITNCYGQTTKQQISRAESIDTTYLLGDYLINPNKKQISIYKMTGGYDKESGIHWDGYYYAPDSTINYDSTTLFIIGNTIFFKEQVEFSPNLDLNTLRVIRNDLDEYGCLLCRDKNSLYEGSVGSSTDDNDDMEPCSIIDLSGYTTINDYIYKKGGDLYFLLKEEFELEKIEGVTLDIPTLKHLMNNYFTDKNGLYLLGGYGYVEDKTSYEYDKSVQLEKSNGKTIIPLVKRNYLVYDGKVYSPAEDAAHQPLPLNANRIKELELNNYREVSFLADDDHTFRTEGSDGYSTTEFKMEIFNRQYDADFFKKNVNQWQIITGGDVHFIKENNGKTLYFPSASKKPLPGPIQSHVLIKTPDGFYIFDEGNGSTLQKIDQVFIFNFDTKKYEELDTNQYRYVAENLRIYKNRVYGYDGLPIMEPIDAQHLHFITHHDVKTDYLTDGKSLIYIGNMGGITMTGRGNETMQVLDERIISGVDFSTLKVITANILIDKEYIYNGNDGIGVIPIKALQLDVKIFTE